MSADDGYVQGIADTNKLLGVSTYQLKQVVARTERELGQNKGFCHESQRRELYQYFYILIFHDMQFNAPPLRTASNAGISTALHIGIASLIC